MDHTQQTELTSIEPTTRPKSGQRYTPYINTGHEKHVWISEPSREKPVVDYESLDDRH